MEIGNRDLIEIVIYGIKDFGQGVQTWRGCQDFQKKFVTSQSHIETCKWYFKDTSYY